MSATKASVLIVEDDADNFEWIRRRIAKYGYEAQWASSLSEGLAKLHGGVDCVILDLALPDGHGTEIIKRIRHANLPAKVAVVTGTTDSGLASDAAAMRPDAFFLKPVDAIHLVTWLESVFT